jgi:hypothetical protein
MFLLVNCNVDGDTYQMFNDADEAKSAFDKACDGMFTERVVLMKPNDEGKRFGFGSQGDVFGAEVVFEFETHEMVD